MILQDIFEFNQPNLEGGLDLSIHEEDIWPVRIHVQNLVVVPDIEMLFKWSVVESRQDIYDDSNLLVPRLVAMLAIVSQSVSRRAAGYMCRRAVYQLLVPSTATAAEKQNFK